MADKSKISIVSKRAAELSSNITVNDITYHAQTEDMGKKTCTVISNIYLKGAIVYQKKSNYTHLTKLTDYSARLRELMERQHQSTIDFFVAEESRKEQRKSDYFEEVKQLLRRGNAKSALNTLKIALVKFPKDPFLMSYYGCLVALVENKPKEGVAICEDAIRELNHSMPFGTEFFYPVFYLNLGRAHMKDRDKKAALSAFSEGLKHDRENRDLLWELKKMGTRRKPVLPFLSRSNPVNKYIGKLLYAPKK